MGQLSGSVGSLGPVSLSPVDRSISISQDSGPALENNWLPSPSHGGSPGAWASWAQGGPPVSRAGVVHLRGQSLMGQEGNFWACF